MRLADCDCATCRRYRKEQEDKMSDNEKCQNEGCGLSRNGLPFNCAYVWEDKPGHCFTATPTISTPTAELKALQDKIAELEADALKWRALLSADRIRVLGSAGFPEQGSDNKTSYRHFGLDLWNGCDGVDGEKEGAIEILELFVKAIDKARK